VLSHHLPGALHQEDPDSAPEPVPPVRDAARLDLDDGAAAGEEDLVVVRAKRRRALNIDLHNNTLLVVPAPSPNFRGAIHLLRQHDARELVRQC